MTNNTGAAARSRLDPTSGDADNVDRILLAACAAIWLAALGSAVAATVALVDLGSGHQESSSESGTPWLLYGVIAVSALVILGAIPLLVRARRAALDDPRARPRRGRQAPTAGRTQATSRAPEPPHAEPADLAASAATIRQRGAYPSPQASARSTPPYRPSVDRVWLRCAVVIASAIGLARAGHRCRHLPDGGRPRHVLLGRLRRGRARHAGDARHSVVLPAPAARAVDELRLRQR